MTHPRDLNEDDPRFIEWVRNLPIVGHVAGTTAFYDEEKDRYYNDFGQRLVDPKNWEPNWGEDY